MNTWISPNIVQHSSTQESKKHTELPKHKKYSGHTNNIKHKEHSEHGSHKVLHRCGNSPNIRITVDTWIMRGTQTSQGSQWSHGLKEQTHGMDLREHGAHMDHETEFTTHT